MAGAAIRTGDPLSDNLLARFASEGRVAIDPRAVQASAARARAAARGALRLARGPREV